MIVGYARTSTVDQIAGYEAQERELRQAGADRIFCEQVSSVAHREQLQQALDFVREGDTFVVTRLDRLARSMAHLAEIVGQLEQKKVTLKILAMGLDTSSATGLLMLNVLSSVAAFEREVMLERQREGIAKAKAEGKYRGRKPTALTQAGEVMKLKDQGFNPTQIARKLGIGRSSVYRCFAEAGESASHSASLAASAEAERASR
jgi:DNA invertase Pin-like site-specific DNA recombinase